jgi:hypothetical protein
LKFIWESGILHAGIGNFDYCLRWSITAAYEVRQLWIRKDHAGIDLVWFITPIR